MDLCYHYCRAAGQVLTKHFYSAPAEFHQWHDSKGTLPRQGYLLTRNTEERELFTKILFLADVFVYSHSDPKVKNKVGDATVQTVTLHQLAITMQLHLPPDVTLSDSIHDYRGEISQHGKLVNTGEYICFSNGGHVSAMCQYSTSVIRT